MTSQVATTGDDCSRPRSGREAKQVSPCQAELQAASHQPPDPFVVRWCAARRGDEAPKALPVAGNLQACAVCLGRSVGTDNPPTVFWLAGGAVARRWVCWRLRPALACRWWPPVPSPCLPAKEASAGQLGKDQPRFSLASGVGRPAASLLDVSFLLALPADCLQEEPGTIGGPRRAWEPPPVARFASKPQGISPPCCVARRFPGRVLPTPVWRLQPQGGALPGGSWVRRPISDSLPVAVEAVESESWRAPQNFGR